MTDIVQEYAEKKARAAMVDGAATDAYMDMLFGAVEWEPHHRIALRPIGEKTGEHGAFGIPPHYIQPHGRDPQQVNAEIKQHIEQWAAAGVASYVYPAVLKWATADASAAELVTAICCDLDRGDPFAAVDYASRVVGPPTMIVASGGVTEEGKPKLHCYWQLSEPTDDIHATMLARQALIDKIGADPALGIAAGGDKERGRVHQPIRIAGSVHCKGAPRKVSIVHHDPARTVELSDFNEAMGELVRKPGLPEPAKPRTQSSFTFSADANADGGDTPDSHRLLEGAVRPNSADGIDRWAAFSATAGLLIRTAREAGESYEVTLPLALALRVRLGEGWDDGRIEREFRALWDIDAKAHAPQLPMIETPALPSALGAPPAPPRERVATGADFDATRFQGRARPPVKQIVKGLIMAGKHHLLVAEGGAGKTIAMLELAVKVAEAQPGDAWLGAPMDTTLCGPVWFYTTEDDDDEITDRLHDLGLMERINRLPAGRLRIVPTIHAGGAFPLVVREKDGSPKTSSQWAHWLKEMEAGERPVLVMIDTTNSVMHGDENSATVVNEFVQQATKVCGRLGSALICSHHIKKKGDEPITSPEDMLDAVRGSGALPSAFRAVLGIWHADDYREVLEAFGEPVRTKAVYKMAVVKGNNKHLDREVHYLGRNPAGFLVNVTKAARAALLQAERSEDGRLAAAVRHLIDAAELQQRPMNASAICEKRSVLLPGDMKDYPKPTIRAAIGELLSSGGYVELSGPSKLKGCIVRADGRYAAGITTEIHGGGFERPAWAKLEFDPVTTRYVGA